MRLMWCIIIGLLAFVTKTFGADCPDVVVRRVKEIHWARCNEENNRNMEELKQKTLNRNEKIWLACCVLSDTFTCWVDSIRSQCGNQAANEFIKSAVFKDDCASWQYPESISQCQLSYTNQETKSTKQETVPLWLITIIAILVLVAIASVVFWGVKKYVRRSH